MKLSTAHTILIVGAIGLASIFMLRALWSYSQTGQSSQLGLGTASALAAGGAIWYLLGFRRKLAERRKTVEKSPD